ncbi:MAG: tetracycline destructase [Gammaproteobacteria bacterium]
MVKQIKILVSGVGIAGPALCYWLKRFGFSPTIIEKSPAIRLGGQALDVRGVATKIARKMGIYEKICEMRTQIEVGRYVDTAGKTLHEVHGEKFGFRQDDEVEILRGDLVNILMNSVSTVTCRFNQWITRLDQTENNIVVDFNDGTSEQYDVVIGADGIYSGVRKMIFHENEYQLFNLGSYLSTFTIPNYLNLNRTELVCEANGKLLTINSDKDPSSARAGFMFRSDHVLKNNRDESEQKIFLRETFKEFGWESQEVLKLMTNSHDFYFDSITQVKMNKWYKGRVALIGDAGYCASPLSGQGNNLAFVGAYVLAGELKVAKGNYIEAFKRYHELLKPFVDANQQFGVWVSESYLLKQDESVKKVAEERNNKILSMMKTVSNAITLPEYD